MNLRREQETKMKKSTVILSCAIGAASAGVCSAFAALESKASKGNLSAAPRCVLILGCRVRGEKAEKTLQTRIDAAAKYLLENPRVVAVCCGGIVHEDQTKSEALVIKEGLVEKGIDEKRIFLEDKSLTTEQNFLNALPIIKKLGFSVSDTAFLSSEFHLLRAGVIAKNAGFKKDCIAAPSPKEKRLANYIREFVVFPAVLKKG